MIGFVVTQEQADAANTAIAKVQTNSGLSVFWLVGSYSIHNGEHAGKYFVPCDDVVLSTPLIGNPPQTPQDFPEFITIIESMGGLNSRINLPETDIILNQTPL